MKAPSVTATVLLSSHERTDPVGTANLPCLVRINAACCGSLTSGAGRHGHLGRAALPGGLPHGRVCQRTQGGRPVRAGPVRGEHHSQTVSAADARKNSNAKTLQCKSWIYCQNKDYSENTTKSSADSGTNI